VRARTRAAAQERRRRQSYARQREGTAKPAWSQWTTSGRNQQVRVRQPQPQGKGGRGGGVGGGGGPHGCSGRRLECEEVCAGVRNAESAAQRATKAFAADPFPSIASLIGVLCCAVLCAGNASTLSSAVASLCQMHAKSPSARQGAAHSQERLCCVLRWCALPAPCTFARAA
jgi:hypothetical protein